MNIDEFANGRILYNAHKNVMGAPLNVFFVGANLVFKQLINSPENYWGEGVVRLANGYAQALQIAMQDLSAKEIALHMKGDNSNVFFEQAQLLFQYKTDKFPALHNFMTYWNGRLPEVQRYINLS